jgi:hypothetical protein
MLHAGYLLAYVSTLMMEMSVSSKRRLAFSGIQVIVFPENRTLLNYSCENSNPT